MSVQLPPSPNTAALAATSTILKLKSKSRLKSQKALKQAGYLATSVALGLLIWQVLASHFGPGLLSSPATTAVAAIELLQDGTLVESSLASLQRILIGWSLGIIVGAPLGIIMGRIKAVRNLLDPYIEFFRFIPPIAFVTLAIAWFGIGETSKIVLIFYTSVFIVVINTIAGVLAIDENKLLAAQSLGAGRRQMLFSVVLPAAVPHIITGARLAMGNSFLTIVSAEMVAAQSGIGSLIWQSRNYGRIDWIIVGILTLGVLGYVCDLIIRAVSRRLLTRYGVRI
jgi:NitT/TauT family transport system permease protein